MEQPIEVSAKTVEEAIELALKQLGARRDEVQVEILSRGKPGFLGFGAELARVRLIRSSALEREVPRPRVPQREARETREGPPTPREPRNFREPRAPREPREPGRFPRPEQPRRIEPAPPAAHEPAPAPMPAPATPPAAPARAVPTSAEAASVQQVVDRLMGLMQVKAQTALGQSSIDAPGTPVVQVTGEDAGLLIGRGGETLRALQLLANLIASHAGEHASHVVVDVERYRERRGEALTRLAKRIADRVASSGRPFTLEPMPAYERRLIHLALADDSRVVTESVGEGEDRKVNVRPREAGQRPRNGGGVPQPRGQGRGRAPGAPRPQGGGRGPRRQPSPNEPPAPQAPDNQE